MLRSVASLSLLEMPVNLLQYRGSVGIFNNRNFFVQSEVSHFTYPSDNNNNNNNLAIGLLILSNKIAVVLLLLNLMFVFKGNGSKYKKINFIWALLALLALSTKLRRPFQYVIGISTVYVHIILQSCLF